MRRQKSCDVPLDEKHRITVVADVDHYSLSVDEKPIISVRDRKNLLGKVEDNKMIMIFYNRNGEIDCDVSCNCWDWAVYFRYQLPYSSPTANLLFPPKDFLLFISDMPRYLKEELVQIDLESFHYRDYVIERKKRGGWGDKNPEDFIYARLGDVDFVAWHYDTFEEVKDKWDRRKERVNYDKILFKMHDLWDCTFEDFKEFLKLTEGKNSLFLTAKKEWKEYAASNPNVIYIKKYADYGYVVDDVHHNVLPFTSRKTVRR